MNIKIGKEKLSPDNEREYRTVFKKCFPAESWKVSVPFVADQFYAIRIDTALVGFCCVHDTPPYKLSVDNGVWIYNFCVDPSYQKQGHGLALMQTTMTDYPKKLLHVETNNVAGQQFVERAGFRKLGLWRQKFIEYCHGYDVADQTATVAKEIVKIDRRTYDPDENLIYLS